MGFWRTQKTLDRLEDRLRTQETKLDDLERHNRNLNLEFTELYDKVSHQMSRMAKRDARARAANGGDELPVEETETDDGVDPISRSILARRGRVASR